VLACGLFSDTMTSLPPSTTRLDPVLVSTWTGMIAIPLWSVAIGVIRSVSEIFGPLSGAALIYTVSGLLAASVLGLPGLRTLRKPALWYGAALFCGYEIALAMAIGLAHNRQQALEVGMINYLWPGVTILFAVLTRQQRGSWWLIPAIACCLLGIGCVMQGDQPWSTASLLENLSSNPLAYGYAFTAAVLWGVYSVVTRRFDTGKNAVPFYFLITALILWGKYALSHEPQLVFHTTGMLQVVIFAAMSATAYACWNRGVVSGNISLLATASYFTPVLSAFLTCLWLGIRPAHEFWLGVFLVTAGSLISWVSTRSRSSLV